MKMKIQKNSAIIYIILLLIILFSISPWFNKGVPATDDFRHHLTKFWYIKYSYENHCEFLEWMPFIYSGWPLTHFYHSLPYYLSIPLIIALKPVASLKASIALSFILSALAMFFSAKLLFKKNEIALVAAAVYLFMPMHFEFAYISGSISRLWAYVFLPLAAVFFIKLVEERSLKYAVLSALSFTALMLSNFNIAFTLAVIMAFYLVYYLIKNKKLEVKSLAVFALLVLLLSAFWTIPMVLEGKQTTAKKLGNEVFVKDYNPVSYKALFVRSFGQKDNTRYFYYGYALLILVIISAFIAKFKYKNEFLILSALCFLLATTPKILTLLPYSKLILSKHYLILASYPLLAMLAGVSAYALSKHNKRYFLLILLAILAVFLVDVIPAYSTYQWSNQPTENYLNPEPVLNAYDFVKKQPGLFRAHSLIGEVPYIYTEKMEIGLEWTGYREGALKPIREITDEMFHRIIKNVGDEKTAEILGYFGAKYYVLPCMTDFPFVQVYSNAGACVYENPYFKDIIISPDKIIINKAPDVFNMQMGNSAILLEECENNCMIENNASEITNINFNPEEISFEVSAEKGSYVLVKSAYFRPHWNAYINSEKAEIKEAWPVYFLIAVPPGHNEVILKYENNWIHTVGRTISILTVLALAFLIYCRRKK